MTLAMQTQDENRPGLQSNIPDGARVLIVCDDDYARKRLSSLLSGAGFALDCANSLTAGCEVAKSGQYQVVVSVPELKDGSWRRLIDIANHYNLQFEVVLWAHNFDLREWAEALDNRAFDVLDAVYDQSSVVEATKCAFWAAYLKGALPNSRAILPHKMA
jgi:DNA-binding NtrC family response regulator